MAKENGQDLKSLTKSFQHTVFHNNFTDKELMSSRREPNKQNRPSNTIQFTKERYQLHIHSMSQTMPVPIEKKKKKPSLLLPLKP